MKYTYLICANNLYKIGHSNNPKKRLSQLRVGNPNCELITFGKGISEKELHILYSDFRTRGEWFKLRRIDVEKIVELIGAGKDEVLSLYDAHIYFGKYEGWNVKDFHTKEHREYSKWFIKNVRGNRKIKRAMKLFLKFPLEKENKVGMDFKKYAIAKGRE